MRFIIQKHNEWEKNLSKYSVQKLQKSYLGQTMWHMTVSHVTVGSSAVFRHVLKHFNFFFR